MILLLNKAIYLSISKSSQHGSLNVNTYIVIIYCDFIRFLFFPFHVNIGLDRAKERPYQGWKTNISLCEEDECVEKCVRSLTYIAS